MAIGTHTVRLALEECREAHRACNGVCSPVLCAMVYVSTSKVLLALGASSQALHAIQVLLYACHTPLRTHACPCTLQGAFGTAVTLGSADCRMAAALALAKVLAATQRPQTTRDLATCVKGVQAARLAARTALMCENHQAFCAAQELQVCVRVPKSWDCTDQNCDQAQLCRRFNKAAADLGLWCTLQAQP
jgi:hypothetical protein